MKGTKAKIARPEGDMEKISGFESMSLN